MEAYILTDEEKLEKLKKQINALSEALDGYITTICSCGVYEGTIPNLGIYYGNKLIEIYKYLKNHKVGFADSHIAKAVEYYFSFAILTPATNLLTSYMQANTTYKARLGRMFGHQTHENDMMLYKNYCTELSEFDIEKDIELALDYHLMAYKESKEYINDMDEILVNVNKELQKLGINRKYQLPVQKKKNMA